MKTRGGPVSRVLSWAAIYLLRTSPSASSAQPERSAGHTMALLFAFAPDGACQAAVLPMALLFAFAPDGACQAAVLPRRWWSLTPPFQLFPLRGPRAGQLESSFLRRFPSGYPARPLAGILPCGARTFLMTRTRVPRSPGPPRVVDSTMRPLPGQMVFPCRCSTMAAFERRPGGALCGGAVWDCSRRSAG